ncbi:MAG: hypothetical protein FJ170_01340 [Gammaproteobacteria bacterium]|nr:hypothetical protein [Gammaproteobacteria bacterium]
MTPDIEQRRARLLQRCAVQREDICSEIQSIEAQLGGVQRGLRIVQGLTTLPGLLVAGSALAILAATGRGRAVQLLSTGLGLWAAVRRFRHGRARLAGLLYDTDP